jgi:hypothetical protein
MNWNKPKIGSDLGSIIKRKVSFQVLHVTRINIRLYHGGKGTIRKCTRMPPVRSFKIAHSLRQINFFAGRTQLLFRMESFELTPMTRIKLFQFHFWKIFLYQWDVSSINVLALCA